MSLARINSASLISIDLISIEVDVDVTPAEKTMNFLYKTFSVQSILLLEILKSVLNSKIASQIPLC